MVPIREPKTYSILLAHGLTLVRKGLPSLCREQLLYWVVDQCSDGNKALRLVESAVLDLNLPGLFSLEIVRRLRRTRISARIVMLSASTDVK